MQLKLPEEDTLHSCDGKQVCGDEGGGDREFDENLFTTGSRKENAEAASSRKEAKRAVMMASNRYISNRHNK